MKVIGSILNLGKNRVTLAIYYLMRALVLLAAAVFFFEKDWQSGAAAVLVFILMTVPSLLRERKQVYLPFTLEFGIVFFLFCTLLLGQIMRFYDSVPHWDTFLHVQSGLVLGTAGFVLIYTLNEHGDGKLKLSPGFIALFAITFAVFIGVLWEICEYAADLLFDTRYWQGQTDMNADTMNDLIADTIGAVIVSVTGYFWMYRHKRLPLTPWPLRLSRKDEAP
jgi:VanZ family protein